MATRQDAEHAAASRLLDTYADLAAQGAHLLDGLLADRQPIQWAHYPDDDAIDGHSGYQWFYHSHAPQDRPGSAEHGHIHLFARRKLWSRRLRSKHEMAFAALTGARPAPVTTRHLLAIGFDAKGVPSSLFTVNSWVTGDRMLSASTSCQLLQGLALDTGHPALEAVLRSIVTLYRDEIQTLMQQRDARLRGFTGGNTLANESLELLSELALDVDGKLAGLC